MDASDLAFVAFVREHEADLQRRALQALGDAGVAGEVTERVLVRLHRRLPADRAKAQRLLDQEIRSWRRGAGRGRLLGPSDGASEVARFEAEPLDAEALVARARAVERRRRRARPVVAIGVVAVLALGTTYALSQREEQQRAQDAASASSLAMVQPTTVDVSCSDAAAGDAASASSASSGAAARVVAGADGVRLRVVGIPEQHAALLTWPSPRGAVLFASTRVPARGGEVVTLPIAPGGQAVVCVPESGSPEQGSSPVTTHLDVLDPNHYFRGDLAQAGCAPQVLLQQRGYLGAGPDEAVGALVRAQPTVSMDVSPLTVEPADAGYPDATPSYFGIRGGPPQFAVEVAKEERGWVATPRFTCTPPGERPPDRPLPEAELELPTTVGLTCKDGVMTTTTDLAVVDTNGLRLHSTDRETTDGAMLVEWQVGDQRGTEQIGPQPEGYAIPPGEVSLSCAEGGRLGPPARLRAIDPNGAWRGVEQDWGCDPEWVEPGSILLTEWLGVQKFGYLGNATHLLIKDDQGQTYLTDPSHPQKGPVAICR